MRTARSCSSRSSSCSCNSPRRWVSTGKMGGKWRKTRGKLGESETQTETETITETGNWAAERLSSPCALIWRKTLELVFAAPPQFSTPHLPIRNPPPPAPPLCCPADYLFFSMNSHTGAAARLSATFSFTSFLGLSHAHRHSRRHSHRASHRPIPSLRPQPHPQPHYRLTYQAEYRMRSHYAAIVDGATPIGQRVCWYLPGCVREFVCTALNH